MYTRLYSVKCVLKSRWGCSLGILGCANLLKQMPLFVIMDGILPPHAITLTFTLFYFTIASLALKWR